LVKCEAYQELIPQYLLDALSAQERALLRNHLQTGCPKCAGAMAEAEAVMNLMPLALPPVNPPPLVREKVMARVAAWAAASRDLPVSAAPMTGSWRPWALALAASIAAVALGAWGAHQSQTAVSLKTEAVAAGATVQRLQSDKAAKEQAVQRLQGILMKQQDQIRRMQSPEVQVASLQGTPAQLHATGRLFLDRKGALIDFAVAGLSPAPAGKTYELWVVTPDQRKLPVGTFDVNSEGEGFLEAPAPATSVALAAVTDEPGFVKAPTGHFQLTGKVEMTP
jgi:hypothetical protein